MGGATSSTGPGRRRSVHCSAMEGVAALSGRGLTPEVLDAIARAQTRVAIADDALARIREARACLDRAVAAGRPVYGVTTGLGHRVTTRIDPPGDGEHALRTL